MNHTFKCPHCTAPLNYDAASARLAIKCDHCGMSTAVPEALRAPTTRGVHGLNDAVMTRIGIMLRGGQAIEAIKLIRESTGLGLKESKDIFDALRDGDVDLLNRLLASEDVMAQSARAASASFSAPRSSTTTTVVINGSRAVGGAAAGCGTTVAILAVAVSVALGLGALALSRGTDLLSSLFNGDTPPRVSEVVNNVVKKVSPPFSGLVFVKNSSTLIDGGDGAPPDVLGHGFAIGSSDRYELYYLDTQSQTLRWRADASQQVRLSITPNVIYMAQKSRLAALDSATGKTLWESSLSDQVSLSCDDCIHAAGDRVFVLTNDSELQAFERESGRKVWSQRLSKVSPRIMAWGDKVVVIERNEKAERVPAMVRVLNAAGDEQSRFDLICEKTSSPGDVEAASTDAPILVDADAGMLYAAFGSYGACVQKRNLSTGGLVWSGATDVRFSSGRGASLLLRGGALLAGGQNQIIAADAESGALRVLYPPDEDYADVKLLDERSGVVFVSAVRTRGTRRSELWAIDIKSGERLWDLKFDSEGGEIRPDGYTGLIAAGDDEIGWTVHVTDAGVRLLSLTGKPSFQIDVQTLGLRDGVSAGKKSIALTGDYTLLSPGLFGWRGDVAWLSLSSDVIAIDAARGERVFATKER